MRKSRIMAVVGTRPEAIKMAPVLLAMRRSARLEAMLCLTGQHTRMLEGALAPFGLEADVDLALMRADQSLGELGAALLSGLERTLFRFRPDRLLVHGDTSTTLMASLAALYARIPVGHVEAGLRTGNPYAPWPEEMNRRLVDTLSDVHFAPTERAARALRAEGFPQARIHVTGNSVIDALHLMRRRFETDRRAAAEADSVLPAIVPSQRCLLVTGHRRESFGAGFAHICRALARIAESGEATIVYPVHLSPHVRTPVMRHLSGLSNIHLVEPLAYPAFVRLMMRADLVLTDSGGVQEEAPALGKPVLVMRETTERPEAVEAGGAAIVGVEEDSIVKGVLEIFRNPLRYQEMARARSPYGDGKAAARIVRTLEGLHESENRDSGSD